MRGPWGPGPRGGRGWPGPWGGGYYDRVEHPDKAVGPPMGGDPGPRPGDPPEVAAVRHAMAQAASGPHGLPAGVPTHGPQFVTHLMAAAQRMHAIVRSRVTMNPRTLSYFERTMAGDAIYMADVRNQRTMAHELGHAIDFNIFLGRGAGNDSQASLVTRIGSTLPKGQLYAQLARVSELMRGPIGQSTYRRKASELIADYASLYLHDPAMARAMAPDWTVGWEHWLAQDPETHETVQQILNADVTPVAPERPPGTSSVTEHPVSPPGKVPPRPPAEQGTHDEGAAASAEGIVKDAVRTLQAALQKSRIWTERMLELVPDQTQREDTGAFIEGIGNLRRRGDDIGAVRARMTPAMHDLVRQFKFRMEEQRNRINQYLKGTTEGEYLAWLQDYLPHFYIDGPKKLGSALSTFLKDSPNAHQRKLPTLKEAADLGLTPVTQDPVVLYDLYNRINWRAATNRKAIFKIKEMVGPDGTPLILPKGKAPGWWIEPEGAAGRMFERIYAKRAGEKLFLWRGGVRIHPDVWRAVRHLVDRPTSGAWHAYDSLNAMTRAAAFSFSGFHDVSLRFASLGASMRLSNPARGLLRIMERNPITGNLELVRSTRAVGKQLLEAEDAVVDAAMHGLKFSWTDSEAYQHAARDTLDRLEARMARIPYLGQTSRVVHLLKEASKLRQRGLWRNTHDAYKIMAYHDMVGKALQDAPAGTNPKLIKERIAGLMNDAFGGQEWQTQFWAEPKWQRVYSRFMLAPDWTLSTIRSVPLASDMATLLRTQVPRLFRRETLPGVYEGLPGNLARLKFWGAELLAIAGSTLAAQYVINKMFGDPAKGDKPWVWDNEYGVGLGNNQYAVDITPIMRHMPWRDPHDPTRSYMNLGKRAAEILRWIIEPTTNIESKMSRPLAEGLKQVTGMEGKFTAPWAREHANFPETIPGRLVSAAREFLPFSWQGSQFMLTVPARKGMTKYKAQAAFESIYEVAADTSATRRFLKSFFRGQPPAEGDLISMVAQVSDAAARNGVNPEPLRERALSTIRGRHLALLYKAMAKGDQKAMQHEGEVLDRLGTRVSTILNSLRRRAKGTVPMEEP